VRRADRGQAVRGVRAAAPRVPAVGRGGEHAVRLRVRSRGWPVAAGHGRLPDDRRVDADWRRRVRRRRAGGDRRGDGARWAPRRSRAHPGARQDREAAPGTGERPGSVPPPRRDAVKNGRPRTGVRAMCGLSGFPGPRGLPGLKPPGGSACSEAEDRGFEPRMGSLPNRISSAVIPVRSRPWPSALARSGTGQEGAVGACNPCPSSPVRTPCPPVRAGSVRAPRRRNAVR
jgi:hypothetical protein